ncbi:MAG: TniQ family protein [Pseudomonas sp.]|uniref:TniQ family protein n=1 Tax=Pseudomonas sp. TaxID=306 RepID=UPI003BB64908
MLVNPVRYGNLALLPGEHALGPLGRQHFYSGYRRFSKSVADLTVDIDSFSPAALSRVAYSDLYKKFGRSEQSYSSFLSGHTLLNYYRPFAPGSLSPLLERNAYVMPLLPRNVIHSITWRSCPVCVELAVSEHGFPYFRLEHQLPCATQCALHQCALTSGCLSCCRIWSSLERIGMPPLGKKCSKCGGELDELGTLAYSDSDVAWVHQMSLRLLSSDLPLFTHSRLQLAYQKWLGVDSKVGILNLRERAIVSDAQFELDNRFQDLLYRAFLRGDNSPSIKKRSSKLSVFHAAFSPDLFIPPVFHLLIIRMMFGDFESIPI